MVLGLGYDLDWYLVFRHGHRLGGISGHHLEDRVVSDIFFLYILVPRLARLVLLLQQDVPSCGLSLTPSTRLPAS